MCKWWLWLHPLLCCAAGEEQERVLHDVEEQFLHGVRRGTADKRTLGLGVAQL